MALPPLKSFLPRSLFGRALTILLVPIVVLQLVVGLVFFQRHYLRVTEQMTRSVAYELAYAVEQIEAAGDPAQAAPAHRRARRCRSTSRCGSSPARPSTPGVERELLRLHRRQRRRDLRTTPSTGRSRIDLERRPARAR